MGRQNGRQIKRKLEKKNKADIDILSNIGENLLKLNDPSLTQIITN